ncbi:aldo/keto reductase [uncultured Pseudokineococcus sp.]|uniref:aldo/keto reductase n=1 Tax=uncultured Pseudokineococcus sp. TaxID=1642928 RepID=UPI002611446C|nr:aldo/keto reductase [uncultured Pseudokineococcus sp.]
MTTETTSLPGPTASLPGGGEMPLLGLGTWQSEGDDCYRSVLHALEAGYRHIDTATGYGNEDQVGRALAESGVPRDEVFVTTKMPPDEAPRAREVLSRSLELLGLDFVDLWLVHWPPGGEASPQTWEHFLAARSDRQARDVGVSNYSTAQLDELVRSSGEAPAVDQVPWAPALHDQGFLDDCRQRGVVVEGYSPFKKTDLGDPVLTEVAQAHGVTPQQVVLRWHLEHGVVVIPKSVTPERITANADVFGFSLSPDEVRRVDGLAAA